MRENFTLARERLAVITIIVGEVFGGVLTMAFYFTLLIPFALISIFTTDPLQRKTDGGPAWLQREPLSTELERAKRQG